MSSAGARRDTAAARAALARRRQRGTTPSVVHHAGETTPSDSTSFSRSSQLPPSASNALTTPENDTLTTTTTPATFQTARSSSDTPTVSTLSKSTKKTKQQSTSVPKGSRSSRRTAFPAAGVAARTAKVPTATTAPAPSARTPSASSCLASAAAAASSSSKVSPLRPQNQTNSAVSSSATVATTTAKHSNDSARETKEEEEVQDDGNHDQAFVDEETILDDPSRESLDAGCVFNGSLIVLRPASQIASAVALEKQEQQQTDGICRATTAGMGLGRECETFQLVVMENRNDDDECKKKRSVLRYGDTIVLRSTLQSQTNRLVGVRTVTSNQEEHATMMTTMTHIVGCVRRRRPSPAEMWTVRSRDRPLLLGRAATSSGHQSRRHGGTTRAVRFGDAVALRNHATGGLLSLDAVVEGALTVLTHSYDTTRPLRDSSLIDRLQHHDRMVPSSDELFQVVLASAPPCPDWTSEWNRPMYLDGTFLLHPGRFDFDDDDHQSDFRPLSIDTRVEKLKDFATLVLRQGRVSAHEQIMVDEVIASFMGLEGRFIQINHRGDSSDMQFQISETARSTLEPGLCHLVDRILILSTFYARVNIFVASHLPGYEYGSVMQALCESMDKLLNNHLEVVANLDKKYRAASNGNAMTMSMLYVAIQEPLQAMRALEAVVVAVRDRKGGSLLNALVDLKNKKLAGDFAAQIVLHTLLEKASAPYMRMLYGWLTAGTLHDPVDEFMIECRLKTTGEGRVVYDGDGWNEFFVVRNEHVLQDLFSPRLVQQKIVMTGRYWNAVRYCHRIDGPVPGDKAEVGGETEMELEYFSDLVTISTFIDRMYRSASATLLSLLWENYKLSDSLLVFKKYFLLDQGDFLVHFLDAAEGELLQDVADVSEGRIQSWLSMSVQLTSMTNKGLEHLPRSGETVRAPLSPHDLRCELSHDSLVDRLDDLHAAKGGIDAHVPKTPSRHPYGLSNISLSGFEAFSINFSQIPFPTSLVISHHELQRYQLLFRHVFFAKHVERRLVDIWLDHQMMKQLQSIRHALGPTYCLRQRMLHFMQNFIYYMMFEVIEPNWSEMMESVEAQASSSAKDEDSRMVSTIDDVIPLHSDFLSRTCEECLLMNRRLIRILTKLMSTCLLFTDQMKRFMEKSKITEENQLVANIKQSTIQRNINDPDTDRIAHSKKLLKKKMKEDKAERERRMQLQAARVERELSNESYKRMIARYDEVFTDDLTDFMHQLQSDFDDKYHSHRVNLCIRLNYNNYLTKQTHRDSASGEAA